MENIYIAEYNTQQKAYHVIKITDACRKNKRIILRHNGDNVYGWIPFAVGSKKICLEQCSVLKGFLNEI